jgi:Zn-dependent protease
MRGFHIGRLFSIPIIVHPSWIIVVSLIIYAFVENFRISYPSWSLPFVLLMACLTVAGFFASMILHELGHALTARKYGVETEAIMLFALGAVAMVRKQLPNAKSEFLMAAAGPAVSLAIGIVCYIFVVLLGWHFPRTWIMPAVASLIVMGQLNIGVAIFNVIPAYPMDGGRILAAVLWWLLKNEIRARRWASFVGEGIGYAAMLLGAIAFFRTGNIGLLWIGFIGIFVSRAARTSRYYLDHPEEF